MPNDRHFFSKEYVTPSPTSVNELPMTETAPLVEQLEQAINVEAQDYGDGKPRRKVLRARIAND